MIEKKNVLMFVSEEVSSKCIEDFKTAFKHSPTHRLVVIGEEKIFGKLYAKLRSGFLQSLQRVPFALKAYENAKSIFAKKHISDTRADDKESKTTGRYRKVRNAVLRFQPESILCLTPYDLNLILKARKRSGFSVNVIGITSTFTTDYEFLDLGVDAYSVPDESCKTAFVERGYPENRITVCGMPVYHKAYTDEELVELRSGLALPSRPIVYLNGGVFGSPEVIEVFNMLLDQGEAVFTIVPPFENANLSRMLRRAAERYDSANMQLLSAKENSMQYFAASDIVITTYDSALIFNSMLMKKPTIVFSPMSEVERNDYELLSSEDRVLYAEDKPQVIEILYDVLQRSEYLSQTPIDEVTDAMSSIVALVESFSPPEPTEEEYDEK